jgi:hypothetical protein
VCRFVEKAPERGEPGLPEAAVGVEPLGGGVQGIGYEHHSMRASFDTSRQEARVLEHAQVLRDGGK